MTTKEVLDAMHKGATLCMEHTKDGRVFWLEPRRIIIRAYAAPEQLDKLFALPCLPVHGPMRSRAKSDSPRY